MDPNLRHCTHSVPKHLAAYSAADQVLCINELLDLTFSFMSSGCKTTNARVCKKWCDIALDSVWRKVTDVTDLLEILAPLTTSGYKVGRSYLSMTASPNRSLISFLFRYLEGSRSHKIGPDLRNMDDAFGNFASRTMYSEGNRHSGTFSMCWGIIDQPYTFYPTYTLSIGSGAAFIA